MTPYKATGTAGETAAKSAVQTTAAVVKFFCVHAVLDAWYPHGNAAGSTIGCAVTKIGMPVFSHFLFVLLVYESV